MAMARDRVMSLRVTGQQCGEVRGRRLFVDSQCALYALLSSSPSDCDIVNKCLSALSLLERCGATAHFIWVPSHVGLPHNEKADRPACLASDDLTVHPGVEYTNNYIKSRLEPLISEPVTSRLALQCQDGSASGPAFTVPKYRVSAPTLMVDAVHPIILWRCI